MISTKVLTIRAIYLKKIRQYFEQKHVLEVETPLSYPYPVTDPYIDAFTIETQSGIRFLQTSPEYAMKRLLANSCGSIYQICKAFRNDPKAQYHNHEFTMLEWYRVGLDDEKLRQEIMEMLLLLKPNAVIHSLSYGEVFMKVLDINPHQAPQDQLQTLVKEKIGDIVGLASPNMFECLDLLFSHCIEPWLTQFQFVFIYNYPKMQAALARVMPDNSGELVAKRFELFYQGVELANGYYELTNYQEQKRRFENDLKSRATLGKIAVPIDNDLLMCLDNIPECSGVALGLDRLIMCLEGFKRIDEVLYC